MPTPTPLPPIHLSPALPKDLISIVSLRSQAHQNDSFSLVAFGPDRDTPETREIRARALAKTPREKGRRNVFVKAVMSVEGGEEIVGAAGWSLNLMMEGGGDGNGGEREVGEGGDGEEEDEKEAWGEGANAKLCEDVFFWGDEMMVRKTGGREYAKLHMLVVSPKWQRKGIGKMLIEQGLKEIDELNLQSVLGASKEGKGLYQKHGFVAFDTMEIRLWEYEGGEGFGMDYQVLMHRPAQQP